MDRSEWTTNSKSPDNIEAFNLGYYFFNLVTYSISRIVLVELSIFLSEAEDRSLLDWLNKAKENAASLKPTRCHLTRSDYEPIQPEEYRAIIDDQIAQLEAQKDVIDRIKARRDKALVHLDKKYFDETDSIQTDYPLSNDEIDDIMHLVSCILRKHYNCLLERDITSFEVSSLRNVGHLLKCARAWMRARRDSHLIDKGLRPIDYERDDYGPNKIESGNENCV